MPHAKDPARGLLNAVLDSSAGLASLEFCPLPSIGGVELMAEVTGNAIASCQADSSDENAARRLLRLRQVEALLKKNPSIDGADEETRKARAFAKFLSVQRRNKRSAFRFELYLRNPQRIPSLIALVLGEARMDLFRLLGAEPNSEDWDTFRRASPFSSGTLQGLRRFSKAVPVKDTDAYAKVGPEQALSSSRACLQWYGPVLLDGSWMTHLRSLHESGRLRLVESNHSEVSTQPKDASTDRVIATEPLLNSMAQRGCCEMLKPYLRKWGITLHDQKANGSLARIASQRGFACDGFSTLDLSSASDTVLTPVVKHLLPEGWYVCLDKARTGSWQIDGVGFDSQMFSSMGNGFTFPLQCLLFASLARACIRLTACDDHRWRVYGDDLIVPTGATALLIEALRFCGFIINRQKSHVVGPFRESCGQDWLNGHKVRPVYLKESLGLRTTRHSFFNRLQAIDPAHPCLGIILESDKDPLVGPAIGPTGGETGHYVAPIHVLRRRGACSWDPTLYTYRYTYTTLIPESHKRRRDDDVRRLLAAMAGSPGPRHDIRGTVRYRVGVRVTTTPYVAAPASPAWFFT
jgi:hypothetical protein